MIEEITYKIAKQIRETDDAFIIETLLPWVQEVTKIEISKEELISAVRKSHAVKKHKYMGYRCICGAEVAKNQRYCEYCGQKLLDYEG